MPYRSSAESGSRVSSLALVIGLHGAAIAAALLAKSTIMVAPPPDIVDVYNIDPIEDPDPLPPPPEPDANVPQPTPYVVPNPMPNTQRPTIRPLPPVDTFVLAPPTPPAPPVREPAPPPPVLLDARFASSVLGRLQPPYPAALLRAGVEGSVTVRVTIGADGRVERVDKIRADNDGFFEATERYARRAWRFEPATRDGRPVESSQVHTVRFEIRS